MSDARKRAEELLTLPLSDNSPGTVVELRGALRALLAEEPEAASEAERLLRLTCERLIGTPVAEQSSCLADISLALDAYRNRIAAPKEPEAAKVVECNCRVGDGPGLHDDGCNRTLPKALRDEAPAPLPPEVRETAEAKCYRCDKEYPEKIGFCEDCLNAAAVALPPEVREAAEAYRRLRGGTGGAARLLEMRHQACRLADLVLSALDARGGE